MTQQVLEAGIRVKRIESRVYLVQVQGQGPPEDVLEEVVGVATARCAFDRPHCSDMRAD